NVGKKNYVKLVELSEASGNTGETPSYRGIEAKLLLEKYGQEIVTDSMDEKVLLLMLKGEKETHVYAQAIGIADKPEPEQEREVKRLRDRIEKRLQRLGERLQ